MPAETKSCTGMNNYLQVESERTQLLKHPLVYKLIEDKWSRYGRFLFYMSLTFHIAFVIFLMAFSLTLLNPFSPTCAYDSICMLVYFGYI